MSVEKVLETLKAAGKPLKAGEIVKLPDWTKKK